MLGTDATVDNELVSQKDRLIALIDNAFSPERVRDAVACLNFVTPMWVALGYEYKVREIRERMNVRIDRLIDNSESALPNTSGSSYRAKIRQEIGTYRALRQSTDE